MTTETEHALETMWDRLGALKRDYRNMGVMIFGKPPAFDRLSGTSTNECNAVGGPFEAHTNRRTAFAVDCACNQV